jgi:D-alanyl-D-alanine carboxypeptidase
VDPEISRTPTYLYVLLGLSIVLALGTFEYRNFRLEGERARLETELNTTKQEYASTSRSLLNNIDTLTQLLATTTSERDDLEANLRDEQQLIALMRTQIESVAGAVDVLQKLNDTDRELLEKYSRIYFLNENYVPKSLTPIPDTAVVEPEKEKLVLTDVWPFLHGMLEAASSTGIDLRVISAYRSFGVQGTLKSSYLVTYGSKTANKFSADQGYSEHQLGSTVDFTTAALGTKFTNIEKTPAYQWLLDNAYKYGFILSYPPANTYYVFEPWHWRFVGKELARDLHDNKKYFYDLSQREIDTYLVSLFDHD